MNATLLTTKETQVLKALVDRLYAEAGFTDVVADDLAMDTSMSGQAIGGVLTSLIEKEIVYVDMADVNGEELHFIMLQDWAYHPEWCKEVNKTFIPIQ